MNAKNSKIVSLSEAMNGWVSELRAIDEAEQKLANRKRKAIAKIDSLRNEMDMLSMYNEDLIYIGGEDN